MCWACSGNASFLTAAVAAGVYAWGTYGAGDLYVGAAIDNPDVIDKESSLFAMDGFLALHEATGDAVWLQRAAFASVVARCVALPPPPRAHGYASAPHAFSCFRNCCGRV